MYIYIYLLIIQISELPLRHRTLKPLRADFFAGFTGWHLMQSCSPNNIQNQHWESGKQQHSIGDATWQPNQHIWLASLFVRLKGLPPLCNGRNIPIRIPIRPSKHLRVLKSKSADSTQYASQTQPLNKHQGILTRLIQLSFLLMDWNRLRPRVPKNVNPSTAKLTWQNLFHWFLPKRKGAAHFRWRRPMSSQAKICQDTM